MKSSIKEIAKTTQGSKYSVEIRGRTTSGKFIRERYTRDFENAKHAKLWAQGRIEKLLRGETQEASLPTLKKLWTQYEEKHIVGSRLKPSQQKSLRSLWSNHLEKHFGSMRIDEIDYAAIQSFKHALILKAPKTVNNALIMLKAMLRFAGKMGHELKLPEIEMLKVPKTEPRVYDVPTFHKLVEAAISLSPKHAAVVLLGGEAGLRSGEMLALDSDDLALPMLTVRRTLWRGKIGTSKGNAERVIPLTGRTVAVLEQLKQKQGPVLRTSKGTRLNQTALVRLLRAAQKKADVMPLSLHKLRHTYGTDIARTLGIRAAQVLLGHADVKTTERYSHVIATPETSRAIERSRAVDGHRENGISQAADIVK